MQIYYFSPGTHSSTPDFIEWYSFTFLWTERDAVCYVWNDVTAEYPDNGRLYMYQNNVDTPHCICPDDLRIFHLVIFVTDIRGMWTHPTMYALMHPQIIPPTGCKIHTSQENTCSARMGLLIDLQMTVITEQFITHIPRKWTIPSDVCDDVPSDDTDHSMTYYTHYRNMDTIHCVCIHVSSDKSDDWMITHTSQEHGHSPWTWPLMYFRTTMITKWLITHITGKLTMPPNNVCDDASSDDIDHWIIYCTHPKYKHQPLWMHWCFLS